MGLDEDPWDNFLFHDSRYLLPLICHNDSLALEKQVLIARFIEHSIKTETISQYKITGQTLTAEFLSLSPKILPKLREFIEQFDADNIDMEEEESPKQKNLSSRIREACLCQERIPYETEELIEFEL